jgi:hypothetical protein
MDFHGEAFLTPRPAPKLEDDPLSAVRDCLFNLFAATLHIGGPSSIRNLRTHHPVVTGPHLSHGVLNTVANKLVFLLWALGFNCPNLDVIIPDFLRRKYLDNTLKYVTTASSEVLHNLHFSNRLTLHTVAVLNFGSAFKKWGRNMHIAFKSPPPSPLTCVKYDFFDFSQPCGSEFRSSATQRCVT